MQRIGFGVWGWGRMGARHGQFYAMEKDKFELVAACDTDANRLAKAETEEGIAVYTDPDAFLADPRMELVVIATLSLDHTRHAVEALEKGKHVLLDKPIAVTDKDLETLRRAEKAHPGKLFVLHNLRFEPGFEAVQQVLERGVLGEVNLVKLRRHLRGHYFRSDWQTLLEYGGGLLNNWGNHEIDHAVQLLGSHAADIWSHAWHASAGGNGDDHVKLILQGHNKRVADLEISYNVGLPEPYCTVYGHRGAVVLNADLSNLHLRYIDPDFSMPNLCVEPNTAVYRNPLDATIPWREERLEVKPDRETWEYMDRKLITGVYEQIRHGVPSPVRIHDAFETIRIIQEVKRQNPQFDWLKG